MSGLQYTGGLVMRPRLILLRKLFPRQPVLHTQVFRAFLYGQGRSARPRLGLFHAFLALAALSVMDRKNTPAFWAGIFLFLLFHEPFQTVLTHKLAILHKARLIPFVVAFFKVFYQLAGVIGTLKTIRQPFTLDTILYPAFAAVFRFAHITV